MTEIESIALTAEQVDALSNPDAGFMALTPEQHELIKTAAPDQVCMFYGDALIRFPKARMEPMLETAFKTAARAAMDLLGVTDDKIASIECDDMEFGQTYMRVSVTDDLGKKASAIGMIPDPRAH